MTANEVAIRRTYQLAENKDIAGFVNCFTEDGTFTDESIGVTYRGPKELGRTVESLVQDLDEFAAAGGSTSPVNAA